MSLDTSMQAACSQLLTHNDLTIKKPIVELLEHQPIVVEIESSRIKVYSFEMLLLSKMAPLFDFMSFDIIDEVSYSVTYEEKEIFISRFNLVIENAEKLIDAKTSIEEALTKALMGKRALDNHLYTLIYLQGLNLRQVKLLEAFTEYMRQVASHLDAKSIEKTLCHYDAISKLFVTFFEQRFNPKGTKKDRESADIIKKIHQAIKEVPHITDDQILKLLFEILQAITRTNYYLKRSSIAFKIDLSQIKEHLKGLQPNIESFVYDDKLYGLHLRMSHISRGGLRWSERYDDYRQEIKSLMITQEGKNSIIVPDGAKGGFIIKEPREKLTKELFISYYKLFVHNLLDLIDNRVGGNFVHDKNIIAYDDDDSYFVVAADKGTADMSDIANSIARERGFWLGDAFASGGSNGFNHKELGITAKGAFKSTQRFFIEEGIDFTTQSISVVGIGSMNGDVFGNGMLLSKAFKLLGAVSSREIFIDPDPIPISAFEERQRLFISKKGNWSDYNPSLISKGGGVFLRSSKSIELSPEIQKLIGTTRKTLSGEELGKKLLAAKVDLFFNGGVGTYVKSSDESNLDLGDKQNEAIRLDANEIKARVVCEGGNLGFTQKARIEYARLGGKINIDGIDNAAGVNTSDHEVNLKILLAAIKEKGHINDKEEHELLLNLTEKVTSAVLWNNYHQALAISKDYLLSKTYTEEYLNVISILDKAIESFNRKNFYIPKDENIIEMQDSKGYIVRPILASVLSYSKIFIKAKLLASDFIDGSFAHAYLQKYFPKSITSTYANEVNEHPLKREIIATTIADTIINNQGILFISDYRENDELFISKIASYLINNQLFGANDIRFELYRMDYMIPTKTQYPLLFELEKAINFSTLWMVRYLSDHHIDASNLLDYKETIFSILQENAFRHTVKITENEKIDNFFALLQYLRFSVAVMTVREETHERFDILASLLFYTIKNLKIIELLEALDNLDLNDPSLRRERRQLREIVEQVIIQLTQKIQRFRRDDETPFEAYENFLTNGENKLKKASEEINAFFEAENSTLSNLTIVIHSLMFASN